MRFLLALILLYSSFLYAEPDHDFQMRVVWVKTLKELMLEIEKKPPHLLVDHERKFLENFEILSEAWAESDSPYNCFYGGWPSVKKGKYCQSPKKSNSSYSSSACKSSELLCQPLLFGKGLCVPGSTQSQRNKTFSNCESKFQKEKQGSYDFLKNLSRNEAQDLHELSTVAGKICQQKNSPAAICKKIMSKIGDGLQSLDQPMQQDEAAAFGGGSPRIESSMQSPAPAPSPLKPDSEEKHTDDCPPEEHLHGVNLRNVREVQAAATSGVDGLFETMKADFLSSPFCDPHSVISDPAQKPNPIIIAKLLSDIAFIDFLHPGKTVSPQTLENLKQKYGLSDSVMAEASTLIGSLDTVINHSEEARTIQARAKSMIVQDFLSNYRHDPQFMKKEVEDELVKRHIFKRNDSGEAECPFVGKEAFMKALAGREEVLKRHGGSLKNKDLLTIVDYTRPSNERRMFVVDLKTKKVVHNTWVAHGGGGGNADGKDGLGSDPEMSNVSGSNMSSDGFVIASHPSHGRIFGPNVILKGIDQNNGNMQRRAIILHKWSAPYTGYSAGVQDYDRLKSSYGPMYDVSSRMKTTDFKTAGKDEMQRSLTALSNSVYASNRASATQGCLGVPLNNIKHLDRKGRNIDQVQALREDLPGTLMFNYSGPEMQSKFF